ncbi:MAG TPA: 5-formyltetrahydrofolate cyclo-ligase [Casimicrobiaceae bacterium]|jgi:5-formyltetrahydrofolate cyclo-ligase
MASSAAPTGPALREAKRAMRAAIVSQRDAMPREERAAASQAIAARVTALPAFAAASSVLVTLPFRSEWDSALVALTALAAGKKVIVPRVDVAARVLTLHAVESLERAIAPGYRGIPEPRADTPAALADEIALALVPGVAFDAEGRRLGYGGGYYDRLLPLLAHDVPRIAGAFDLQIVDRVPAASHDLVIDVVMTPTRAVGPRALP